MANAGLQEFENRIKIERDKYDILRAERDKYI